MKLHIFGSLSGTEPTPGRNHTSWALEYKDRLYWFDAGEYCSNTAHRMGLDVRKARWIFISHPHNDHIGGLFNLFCVMRKRFFLDQRDGLPPCGEVPVTVFCPDTQIVDKLLYLLNIGETVPPELKIGSREISKPGVLLEDGDVKVECLPNGHIAPGPDGKILSWSFRIKAGGKRIIYSGDVKSYMDFDPFLREGCDLLLMESGHHSPPAVCASLRAENRQIGELVFLHHGREILRDEQLCLCRSAIAWGKPLRFAYDRMTLEL